MKSLFGTVADRFTATKNLAPVPFTSRNAALFSNDVADGNIGERAYSAYGAVGTLFAIVSQIGNAFASTEWHLYRKTSVRDKNKRTEVLTHSFLDIWGMPVPKFYTGRYFRITCQQHLDLVGETVIVLVKAGSLVLEMWPVRPDRIQPVKHPTKFLTGYIYNGPDGEQVPLELDEVIHIKMPNPADPYRGMGPVQTALNDLDAAKYSAEWNKNFFINGARPGGIIEVDHRMDDNEWNQFVARWRQQHRGVANAHRVAVLENAVWKDVNFNMQDMQFVELRNLPRELIREAFAFPKPMLGTVDDVNRANSDAAKEIMAENITVPRLNMWKDAINAYLLPMFANGKALELDHDNPVPVNKADADRERLSQANSCAALVKVGFDPADAAEAMGLPKMKYVGMSSPASKEGGQSEEDSPPSQPDQPNPDDPQQPSQDNPLLPKWW